MPPPLFAQPMLCFASTSQLSLYVCKHEGGGRIWISAQLECYALCAQVRAAGSAV